MPVAGFENITYNLTKEERNLLVLLRAFLADKIEKPKAVKNAQIVSYFQSAGYRVDQARVRKLINALRTEFPELMALVASAKGYYWTKDASEMKRYLESLTNRYNEIRRVRYHIEKAYIKLTGEYYIKENKPPVDPGKSEQPELF